jgi:hypothetical protein
MYFGVRAYHAVACGFGLSVFTVLTFQVFDECLSGFVTGTTLGRLFLCPLPSGVPFFIKPFPSD